MKILALQADHAGCGNARIEVPYGELAKRGHQVRIADQISSEEPAAFDIVVLQRPGNKWSIPIAEWCAIKGTPLVIEVDDLCWALPEWNPFKEAWDTPAPGTDVISWKIQQETMKRAAAVTCTRDSLAEAVQPFNTNTYVLPNYLDITLFDDFGHDRVPVTIGWFGSHTHSRDLEVIAGIPGKMTREFPDTAVLTVGGFEPAEAAMFHGAREGSSRALPWIEDRSNLNVALSMMDIGLAPLVDDVFNDSKSWIKVLEYGAVGAPTIASDSGPYKAFIQPDFGLLAKTRSEWKAALRELLSNPQKRLAMGKRAREVAEENSIQNNAWRWEQMLEDVIRKSGLAPGGGTQNTGVTHERSTDS